MKKLIWAVDALSESGPHQNTWALLKALTKPTGAVVQPVFVLSPPLAQAEAPTQIEKAYRALAEKNLADVVKKADGIEMLPGKILVSRSGSNRESVKVLEEHSVAHHADAIVVATHARRGMARLFLGSFAETLCFYSKLPVITVNPETRVRERISHILVPTTFQSQFLPACDQFAAYAKSVRARLTLFYKEPELPAPLAAPVSAYLENEAAARVRTGEAWCKTFADRYQIDVALHMDQNPGQVVSSIEEYALAKDCDMIAIATRADSFSALAMGSSASRVIRGAPCPVWVKRL